MRAAYLCACGFGVGWGHVARGIALLGQDESGGSALLVRGDIDGARRWVVDAASRPIPVEALGSDFEQVRSGRFDVALVDDYRADDALIGACTQVIPTVLVDDWMRRASPANAILNTNLSARASDYDLQENQGILCGEQYALIRDRVRQVQARKAEADAGDVVLTLGGSDPREDTARVVDALVSGPLKGREDNLIVVVGPGYQGLTPWEKGTALRTLRDPPNFLELCVGAKLVICGASTTSYELAFLGIPFIPVSFVDNQRRVCRAWQDRGVGKGVDLDDPHGVNELAGHVSILLSDADQRRYLGESVRRVIDGRGPERVWRELASLFPGRLGIEIGTRHGYD